MGAILTVQEDLPIGIGLKRICARVREPLLITPVRCAWLLAHSPKGSGTIARRPVNARQFQFWRLALCEMPAPSRLIR